MLNIHECTYIQGFISCRILGWGSGQGAFDENEYTFSTTGCTGKVILAPGSPRLPGPLGSLPLLHNYM